MFLANKVVYHSFMDAGRTHNTWVRDKGLFITHSNASSMIVMFTSVVLAYRFLEGPGGHCSHLKNTEFKKPKSFIIGSKEIYEIYLR